MQANVYFLMENIKETFDSILLTRFSKSFVSKSRLLLKPTRMQPICIRHILSTERRLKSTSRKTHSTGLNGIGKTEQNRIVFHKSVKTN